MKFIVFEKGINLKHKIVLFVILPFISFSQSIVNTESMSTKTDSTFVFTTNLEGNYTTGNIELVQFNLANQLAYKKNKNLIRLFLNYEFISQDKETISSDYTSQIRSSYNLKKNSLFAFIQGQKAISLSLNSRYLAGFGYRHNLIKKGVNYIDVSFGPFYENELYLKGYPNEVHIINYRSSLSIFSNFKISEKLQNNMVVYYQLNSENLDDYRLYIEPRLVYSLEHFKIYTTLSYRYHSTPYIDIKKTDSQFLFGVTYDLGFN